jgi:Holliday junction resolvase RusA-like endonuclease
MSMNLPIPTAKRLLLEIPLWTTPAPLERPRYNRHQKRVYQPLDNQAALINELSYHKGDPIKEPVMVEIIINVGKGPKLLGIPDGAPIVGKVYGDVDNQVKAVLDAMVKNAILEDDHLVTSLTIHRCWAQQDFTLIRIFQLDKEADYHKWDFNTARTRSKLQPRSTSPSSPTTPPSPSSPPEPAKPKS